MLCEGSGTPTDRDSAPPGGDVEAIAASIGGGSGPDEPPASFPRPRLRPPIDAEPLPAMSDNE